MEEIHKQQILLRVYLDSQHERIVEVPITPESTCLDVIDCCREPGEYQCHLTELWRGCERPIGTDEKPYEILQQWGTQRDEVRFYLRHERAAPLGQVPSWRKNTRNGLTGDDGRDHSLLPLGSDLSLAELQDMAARQQQQIEAQSQLLVAKEQRLRYLKQQELRTEQAAAESERVRKLRERVEAQELKLKKLRALRGQATEQQTGNNSLSSELESIKALFNDKEKELVLAVQRVESLSHQLEDLRKGNLNSHNNPALAELEKLRKEVMLRNKLNEQQNNKLAVHRQALQKRKDDMAKMDSRISELQARLRKKKQAAAGINSKTASLPMYKPSEPYNKLGNFESGPNKQDSKYQTLPYNIKFGGGGGGSGSVDNNVGVRNSSESTADIYDIVKSNREGIVVAGRLDNNPDVGKSELDNAGHQAHSPGSRLMSNFAPKPYGSSYASTVMASKPPVNVSANTSAPSMIYAASGMPVSDSLLDSPKTSTPVVNATQKPSAREMFMLGNLGPKAPNRESATSKPPPPPPPPPPAITTTTTSSSSATTKSFTTTTAATTRPSITTAPPTAAKPTITTKPATTTTPSSYSTTPPSRNSHPSATITAPGGKFFPPLTIETSPTPSPVSTSSNLSPITSAIVCRGSVPIYQVAATTRLPNSSQSVASNKPQQQGPSSPPGKIQIANSHKVQLTAPQTAISESPKSVNTLPSSLPSASSMVTTSTVVSSSSVISSTSTTTASSSSLSSSRKPSDSSKPADDHKGPVDTSGESVNSAISVLMSGGGSTTTGNTTKPSGATYRYAPRSVIANTYMSKLGTGALDQYRKNMNTLYSSFPGGTADKAQQGGRSPDQELTPSKDAERLRYRPNAPRPLRRRLSTGDSPPTSEGARHVDVIRVDAIQDAYNNNNFQTESTSFTGSPEQLDTIPFADEAASPEKHHHHHPQKSATTPTSPIKHVSPAGPHVPQPLRKKKASNLKNGGRSSLHKRRVSFDPLALLLDASLEGELDLVKQCAEQVPDPSQANDEGITALHNTICAGHFEIVKFLVEFGCNVNAPDSDGWTPLHCAASCNNLAMVRLLVEHGACIFATTISDQETAADKCEEDEDGYDGCSDYLYSIQEKLGIINGGIVYAVFDYDSQNSDELSFRNTEPLTILRKGDDRERDWWWARKTNTEGYIPRNLLGLYPRVPLKRSSAAQNK